jgi:hypothetical protein
MFVARASMESGNSVGHSLRDRSWCGPHAQYPLASEMGKGRIGFMLGMVEHPFAPIRAQCLIEQCNPGNLRGWIGTWLREWFRQIHTGTAEAYAELAYKLVHC